LHLLKRDPELVGKGALGRRAGIANILQRLDSVAAPFVSDAGFSAAARIVLDTAD
jgi:hypothetical protein